nr:uncharacterized protein LOC112276140 isoform X2 [Physcomitrium patens]|eukprot:XP_024362966.1 uncharacterized protein LOC112276140 isoform X2 [Physcomitrella patens]
MNLSSGIGLKLSRYVVRQNVPLLSVTCNFKLSVHDLRGARSGFTKGEELLANSQKREHFTWPGSFRSASSSSLLSTVRCSSTENRGSVVSGSSAEDLVSDERDGTEQLGRRRLVLYSKPGCCLCDALKEKMQLAFMLGGDNDLSDVELEVRDLTTNEEWERAYQYEIPVLARLRADNSEVKFLCRSYSFS